jgi:hypothetical protein
MILTEKQLQEKARYWQEVLRLRDWDLIVKKENKKSFDDSTEGNCEFLVSSKCAYIRILNEDDYPDDSWVPQDMELTLVHELLHLHFAQIREHSDSVPLYEDFEEQAISAISEALVKVHRKESENNG